MQRGGVVARDHPDGPLRLFNKKMQKPALAISRSIGDTYAHSLGVIGVPDTTHRLLESTDRIVVLASDGVWE